MATYVNNLRLKEIATGDEDGTWGSSTNTNLELIGEAFGYGTEDLASDANTTITMGDGTSDGVRSMYLKITSTPSLTATREVTLGPNTVSKVWIIENATSGGQTITIKQGSGATVDIPTTKTKIIYTDGAGAGAAVNEVALLTDGAIGSTIQAQGDVLDDLNALGASAADGEFLVATGAGFLDWESGATAAASMFSGTSLTAATVASNDKVIIQDVSDGNSIKTVTAQSIADLGGGGGGGGATDLDGLTDVTLASQADAQVMIYDSGSTQWENHTLTGAFTINNTGTATLANSAVSTSKIEDDAVTYPKMQNVTATARVLGRISAGAGVVEELTGSEVLVDIIGTTAVASELDYLDITAAGTGQASKALVLDANGDVTTPGEFKATSYNDSYTTFTSSSNACTVDCEAANYHAHVLTENTTATFSNPPATGTAYSMVVKLIQDGSGSGFTFTWPASVDWPNGTAPTLSSGANDVDFFLLITHDGGTTWYGFTMGQDLA